jgi:ABC-type branched-subunit amino acid transport system ATPase component
MSADAAPALLRLDGVALRAGGGCPPREFTLDVDAGEAVGVLGPRGSGKTALLDVVSGFLRPARGRITLGGTDVTGWAAFRIARAGVARSFQTPRPPDGAAVDEALVAAAVGRRLSARELREAVGRGLAVTGLETMVRHNIATLSPAGRRLLSLACIVAAAPRLALLDEPLAGLDPDAAGVVIATLRRLRDLGITLVVTAHEASSLRVVCSRAVYLRGGRIAGPAAEVRSA